MMESYKALPQKTKNYIQLGVLVAALGGIYFRDSIREKMYPSDESSKLRSRTDVSQAAK